MPYDVIFSSTTHAWKGGEMHKLQVTGENYPGWYSGDQRMRFGKCPSIDTGIYGYVSCAHSSGSPGSWNCPSVLVNPAQDLWPNHHSASSGSANSAGIVNLLEGEFEYENEVDIDERIATIEFKMWTESLKLAEEKECLKEIAELKKGLLEATQLRNEEKAKNALAMEMAQAGADSVDLALSILKEFYDKSFLQTHLAGSRTHRVTTRTTHGRWRITSRRWS